MIIDPNNSFDGLFSKKEPIVILAKSSDIESLKSDIRTVLSKYGSDVFMKYVLSFLEHYSKSRIGTFRDLMYRLGRYVEDERAVKSFLENIELDADNLLEEY